MFHISKIEKLSERQVKNISNEKRLRLTIKGLIVRTHLLEKSIQLRINKTNNFKKEFNRAKSHILVQSVLSDILPMKKNKKLNRKEYFNFISDLKKQSIINLDTVLIKEFVMSANE